MDAGDPWDWSVERVVQELCTQNRSWQPYSTSMARPDPSILAKALREQEVSGPVLLMEVDDNAMKRDLGIKIFGHRSFIRSAIADLRVKSAQYHTYMETHHPQSAVASHHSRSLHEFGPQHAPAIEHLRFPNLPLSPGQSPAIGPASIERRPPSDESVFDAFGNKRRKLDAEDPANNDTVLFEDEVYQNQPNAKDKVSEDLNGASTSEPQPDSGTLDGNGKKRKRIAPTLITSEINPNRNRDVPTDADNVVQHRPQNVEPDRDPAFDPAPEPEFELALEPEIEPQVEPGISFVGKDGRRRLAPILESGTGSYTYAKPDQLVSDDQASEKKIVPTATDSKLDQSKGSRPVADTIATGYLGKRKMCVDDIFYAGVEAGKELPPSNNEEELCYGPSDISLGRRLYVNRMMRHFLRSELQNFMRGDEAFTAVVPYDPKLAPRFQKPSFTLYSASSEGQVQARREQIPSWPEIDPEASAMKPFPNIGEYSATFNPIGPDMLNGLGSYDDWDPSSLEKYHHLEGGDTVLPVYGDSDEENEYDEETWQEIEAEQGRKLERPMRKLRNPPISDDEVNAAVNRSIASFVAKWTEKKLPKLQLKAFRLWNKSRKLKTWKSDISAAQNDLSHLTQRITKIRDEILLEIWTSETQVLRQSTILEPSIYDREALAWKTAILEQKKPPEKPSHAPLIRSKKAIVRHDDREGEGESLDSDSSSDDEMDDFIVDDDPMDLAEVLAEEHELDLADGEGSDDDTMSDGSLSEPRAATSVKTLNTVHKGSPATSTSSTPPSEKEGPSTITPPAKGEEPTLPRHRSSTVSSVGNMIDLTMLSSDSGPEIISLLTPKKKKGKIALFSRNSPLSSPIPLDLEHDPDPNKLPTLTNPAGIGKYPSQAWENILDRERLLISILFQMEPPLRTRIFDFISTIVESELWYSMAQVMASCRFSNRGVKGLDGHTFETLTIFIRLFEIYVDCRNHPFRELPTASSILKVEESQKKHFTPFFKLFQKLPGYFAPKTSSEPSLSPTQQKSGFSVDEEDDEDGEPLSGTRRRRSDTLTTSDDDYLEEDSPRKKQRKVFENVDARNLREQDRLRMAELEERRKKLQKKLASSDQHGVLNEGQIIVNDAKADDEGYIYVHPHVSGRIKKHQTDGIRFMWNQIVGDEKVMQGCLLAHTMGLGKTMQVITLLVAIAEAAASKDSTVSSQVPKALHKSRTLVLCPPGLVGNWIDELLTWVPGNILGHFRQLNASVKPQDRLQTITQWYEDGGVLVVGYEMFRALIQNKETKSRGAALSERVHARVKTELLEGPNIIIADEAHKLKNAKASITTVANQFKSSSRIALTGSPLANNVEEYHTMIDWVAPNYLGPAKEFRAKYVEPIELGLWQDSSSSERRKSLKMLGVLKEDIAPKVHRADVSVLRNDLPPKKEFVIKVPLTGVQRKAYSVYVNSMVSGSGYALTKDGQIKQSTLWHWLAVLALLCNHPACFSEKLNERKGDAKKEAARVEEVPASKEAAESGEEIEANLNEPIWKVGVSQQLIQDETSLFQAEGVDMKSINLSYKVKITCQILDAARDAKDKVLVFSQSIPTLNFLEELFAKQRRKFMRLDGKTKMSARQGLTKDFNTGDLEVYLISTTAGGLGLNLPGANRVIIFDFKFNPIQEEQAVGRAYRIGQKKPTFVYRFVVAGTFEDTVHNKTIYKMQLASRVVDKKNPIAHAKKNVSDFLFEPRDIEQQDLSELKGMDPKVLDRILASQKSANTIRAIVQSDTFELDDDDKLTAEEEREVKQLLIDEKLKRSNPRAWLDVQAKRERVAQRINVPQASNPLPTAMNPGPRVVASTPLNTPGRPGQGHAQPTPQRTLSAAQGPTTGVGTPTTAGNTKGMLAPTGPASGAAKFLNPPPNAEPAPSNSASAANAIPNKESKDSQLPTSDRGRSPNHNGTGERTRSVTSERVPQPASLQSSRSSSLSRLADQESKDIQNLRSVLLESAKKRTGMIETQTLQMATKLSVDIDAAIKRFFHRNGDVSLNDASAALREDSKKCYALLNSKMSPNAFVRGMLTSPENHESTVEAERDDITTTDIFAAMNRRPVPSLKTPVTKPPKSSTNKPFRNPRRDEDLREVERVKEKRRARSGASVMPTASSRIPNWALKDIDNAAKKEKEASRTSSTASPSRQ